jgi:hypothetical protein
MFVREPIHYRTMFVVATYDIIDQCQSFDGSGKFSQ